METSNKIIAEFMGFKLQDNPNERFFNRWLINSNAYGGRYNFEEFYFDVDWNWLMQVVEKIESIKIETYKVRVDIYFNCCQINPTHWEQLISIYGNKETKIEAVYNACIEFIKWYNENSAKEK